MEELAGNIVNTVDHLYRIIENDLYTILNRIVFITSNIFTEEPLKTILKVENTKYIITASKFIIFFYLIYFCLLKMFSFTLYIESENFTAHIMKSILILLLVMNIYEIQEKAIYITTTMTEFSKSICSDIAKEDINFESLENKFTKVEDVIKNSGLDGVFHGIYCYFSVGIIISYAIRYVSIIFAIIISPFFVVSLLNSKTKFMFYIWLKFILFNLLYQCFISFIILVPIIARNNTEEYMYNIILIGTVFLLYKVNDIINRSIIEGR